MSSVMTRQVEESDMLDKIKIIESYLENIAADRKKSCQKLIDEVNHNGGMILYGAGTLLQYWVQVLTISGIKIRAVCDRSPQKIGTTFCGFEIKSVAAIIEKKEQAFIIISTSIPAKKSIRYELSKEFENLNFINESYFDYLVSVQNKTLNYGLISSQEAYLDFIKLNAAHIEKVFALLADIKSRKVLSHIIIGRGTWNFSLFEQICEGNQYFPLDLVKLSPDDVMVDGGAFVGDTIQNMVANMGYKCKRIECFEPNKYCYEKLKNNLNYYNLEINFHNAGLSNKNEKVSFQNDLSTGGSSIDKNGIEEISVLPLDEICMDATFIKLDIEGVELSALQGAEKNIIKNKPKIACCIYHKNEDIYTIIEYLSKIKPEYKFYIRHHTTGFYETVLYAI